MGRGPLNGVRVVELAGIGPGPFAGMMLSDLGAEVVRISRRGTAGHFGIPAQADLLLRGRQSVLLDLKHRDGLEAGLRLVDRADVLVEGYRPGVTEGLGLGPDVCTERNPRLVYGRITGWGQEGPWARTAGHDLTYIAVAGALRAIGPADRPPPPPLNYVGDFGGGGMLLVLGVVAALLERERSGKGQVIDAAMVDGAALQSTMFHALSATGFWRIQRQANLLDGAAPYYRTYQCADGEFVAVGPLEPRFYQELLAGLGLDPANWPQDDVNRWPEQREAFTKIFATRTRDEWLDVFAGTDACVAPVLAFTEAPAHPQLAAREVFTNVGGLPQPAPAPRFSRTPGAVAGPPPAVGADTDDVLAEVGYSADDIARLRAAGAAG